MKVIVIEKKGTYNNPFKVLENVEHVQIIIADEKTNEVHYLVTCKVFEPFNYRQEYSFSSLDVELSIW